MKGEYFTLIDPVTKQRNVKNNFLLIFLKVFFEFYLYSFRQISFVFIYFTRIFTVFISMFLIAILKTSVKQGESAPMRSEG